MWQHYVNSILGFWLLVSGYILTDATALMGSTALVGIAVIILGLWGAAHTKHVVESEHTHSHA
ncbi:MAG TPA: hypothetical protein VJI33_01220 [Candidatus Paceibacterota bacterium]